VKNRFLTFKSTRLKTGKEKRKEITERGISQVGVFLCAFSSNSIYEMRRREIAINKLQNIYVYITERRRLPDLYKLLHKTQT
jgi:hypothetical protein